MNRLCNLLASILILAVFITVPVTAPEAAVDTDLVGLWHMDGDWLDSSGNGNNGTPYNGVTFSTNAKIGKLAGSFDGFKDYVLIGSNVPSTLQIQNEISFEVWIYLTQYPSNLGLIVGSQYDVNIAGATIFIDGRTNPDGHTAPPGHINFQIGNGVWHASNTKTQVPLNQWVHIVATRKANEAAKIYFNGIMQPSTSATWSGAISYAGAWFAIGQQKALNRPFKGLLDEVAIYKRALSDAEIMEHYRKYIVISPTVNPVPSPTTSPTITLSGTKTAGTAIVVNGNTLVPLDGATTWQTVYTLSPGTNNLTITAQDSQNFNSLPISLTIVLLDATPPDAPTINPESGLINSTSTTISGAKSSDSASVVVSCPGGTIDTVYYPTATTWFVNVYGLQEGSNTITAYAVDAAGNQSATNTSAIIVDTSPPAVDVTPAGGTFSSSQIVTLGASEPVVIYYTTDGSTPTESATIYSQPIDIPVSATLKYFARDLAGNTSEVLTKNYIIDTTSPVLSISTLSDGAYTNNEILNIAGTVTDDTVVATIMINDAEVQLNADGSFSYALLLKNGTNTISVTAIDSVGNTATETRTVTLDQTAPILTVTQPADNSKTASVLLDLSGSVDKTSNVTIKLKDTVQNALMNNGDFTGTIGLEPGYNTIEITATDLAGNQSSLKRTVLYDNQKPSLAIVEPNQDIRTNQSNLSIKGMVNDTLTAVGVSISMDDEVLSPPVVDGTFEQTVNFTEEKTYNIVITATNEVGTSTNVQRNVIYDITPPAFTIDPVLSPTCQTSQLINGTREAWASVTVSSTTATIGEVTYPTDTTWQAAITALRKGRNVITAMSTDEAGNSVTASATIVLASGHPDFTLKATPSVLWPPNHRMVPVKIVGGIIADGSAIKSLSISVKDEYGKFNYNNLSFGRTVMLEAWRNIDDKDGRKYTITAVIRTKGGSTVVKTATVTVPHDFPHPTRKATRGFCKGRR